MCLARGAPGGVDHAPAREAVAVVVVAAMNLMARPLQAVDGRRRHATVTLDDQHVERSGHVPIIECDRAARAGATVCVYRAEGHSEARRGSR
jgi:hypothetical protein